MSTESSPLTCAVTEVEGLHEIKISGSLCDDGVLTARTMISDTIEAGARHVAVIMADVDFISSSGIGMLVSILKKCRQGHISFALCGLNRDLEELFSLTRLDRVFPIARHAVEWRQGLSLA